MHLFNEYALAIEHFHMPHGQMLNGSACPIQSYEEIQLHLAFLDIRRDQEEARGRK